MRALVIGLALWLAACSDSGSASDGGSADAAVASSGGNGGGLPDGSTAGGTGGSTTGGSGGSTTTDGGPDAPISGGGQDSGTTMTLPDAQPGCPAQQPLERAPCQGMLSCGYGETTCCGTRYHFTTCKCQNGMFQCAMTVACNFVCPDGGP
ncbi:MAG TPA: hypothetical protein VN914_06615 [Polyangia bacterium]|nr:hypothetical protein [Polyangia bacterium]